MPFHSAVVRGKFLPSAVNVDTQRYLSTPHYSQLASGLLDGAATTPGIRCNEPVPSSPEGTVEDAGGRPKNMLRVWSPGLQSENSRDNKAENIGITAFIDHPMAGIT